VDRGGALLRDTISAEEGALQNYTHVSWLTPSCCGAVRQACFWRAIAGALYPLCAVAEEAAG